MLNFSILTYIIFGLGYEIAYLFVLSPPAFHLSSPREHEPRARCRITALCQSRLIRPARALLPISTQQRKESPLKHLATLVLCLASRPLPVDPTCRRPGRSRESQAVRRARSRHRGPAAGRNHPD